MTQKNHPFITVIIPTFNRYQLLRQCLEGLSRLDYPQDRYKIIVVDDGSDDGTQEGMRQDELFCVRHAYVRLETNQGVSSARNCGICLAEGDLVAFLDDDCVVDRDWLKLTVETFALFPQVAAVGGSIVNGQDDVLGWASYILEFSTWFPVGKARFMRNISTSSIVYRRHDVAGMSFPDLGKDAGYEDTMFNHELRARSRHIIFDPRIRVCHYRSSARCQKDGFLKSQRRYALGFIRGGYLAHGVLGQLLFRLSFLNLACPRLLLVLARCCRSGFLLMKFFSCFSLIVAGEWERNKVIFLESRSARL